MKQIKIADAYGRTLNNLRISVTAECNYRCIFCHIEGEPLRGPVKPGSLSAIILPSDYYLIARAAWLIGVEKFKLTGGEPLLRPDISDIIREIAAGAPSSEISMTTNGYLLSTFASDLADAGLARVNISIHSLRQEVYERITGVPGLTRALKGLDSALEAGLGVKINAVILKGLNSDEIWDLLSFAEKRGVILQLIELHPVGLGAKFFSQYFYPLSIVEEELLSLGAKLRRRDLHNRPIYTLPSGIKVEIVRPYSNPLFCAGCSRVRLGPFGDLSPCLNWRGPRPSILSILRDRNMNNNEKIYNIALKIINLVSKRKPFYLWPRNDNKIINNYKKINRINIPKKKKILEAEVELKHLLTEE